MLGCATNRDSLLLGTLRYMDHLASHANFYFHNLIIISSITHLVSHSKHLKVLSSKILGHEVKTVNCCSICLDAKLNPNKDTHSLFYEEVHTNKQQTKILIKHINML